MKKFKVKIFNKAHEMRESSVEAWNIDEAIEKAFSLCDKSEIAFVTKAWSTRSAPISEGEMLTEIRRHHEVRNFKVPPGFDISFRECFKWLINR